MEHSSQRRTSAGWKRLGHRVFALALWLVTAAVTGCSNGGMSALRQAAADQHGPIVREAEPGAAESRPIGLEFEQVPADPRPPESEPGRVIVVSLDGLGQEIWERDPAAGRLGTLRRIADAGVVADGMVQAFPSGTPGAHAALWTGAYGDVSGISAARNPLLPRSEHSFLERGSGFDSSHLLAEPIWVAAARQGVRVVANQATQNYPFIPFVTAADAPVSPVLVSGYGPPMLAPHRALSAGDMVETDPGPWSTIGARSALPIRCGPPLALRAGQHRGLARRSSARRRTGRGPR